MYSVCGQSRGYFSAYQSVTFFVLLYFDCCIGCIVFWSLCLFVSTHCCVNKDYHRPILAVSRKNVALPGDSTFRRCKVYADTLGGSVGRGPQTTVGTCSKIYSSQMNGLECPYLRFAPCGIWHHVCI